MPFQYPAPPKDASSFWWSFQRLLEHEGGYVRHPHDPGGETKYGISKRSYPALDIAALTEADAAAIYYADYWIASGIDRVLGSRRVQSKLLDMVVNVGRRRGVELFQQAVNYLLPAHEPRLDVDGVIGEDTLYAAHTLNRLDLVRSMCAVQASFYIRLVESKASYRAFARGWLRRALSG